MQSRIIRDLGAAADADTDSGTDATTSAAATDAVALLVPNLIESHFALWGAQDAGIALLPGIQLQVLVGDEALAERCAGLSRRQPSVPMASRPAMRMTMM